MAINVRGGVTGAMTGAGLGSIGGPMGMGIGAGIGGALGLTTDLFGGGGADKKAKRELLRKQEQMAREMREHQHRMELARTQSTGQQMLAFNPQNQAMAEIFGPDAAFSPQQMAQMGANPMPPETIDPSLVDMRTPNAQKQMQVEAYLRRKNEREAALKRQQEMIEQGMKPLPQGPAPLARQTTVAPARRHG